MRIIGGLPGDIRPAVATIASGHLTCHQQLLPLSGYYGNANILKYIYSMTKNQVKPNSLWESLIHCHF